MLPRSGIHNPARDSHSGSCSWWDVWFGPPLAATTFSGFARLATRTAQSSNSGVEGFKWSCINILNPANRLYYYASSGFNLLHRCPPFLKSTALCSLSGCKLPHVTAIITSTSSDARQSFNGQPVYFGETRWSKAVYQLPKPVMAKATSSPSPDQSHAASTTSGKTADDLVPSPTTTNKKTGKTKSGNSSATSPSNSLVICRNK